jgi:hypothetical protein
MDEEYDAFKDDKEPFIELFQEDMDNQVKYYSRSHGMDDNGGEMERFRIDPDPPLEENADVGSSAGNNASNENEEEVDKSIKFEAITCKVDTGIILTLNISNSDNEEKLVKNRAL